MDTSDQCSRGQLGTIPIQMKLLNIPPDMWGFEDISRINNSVGIPIVARIIPRMTPPTLLLNVVIDPNFNYPQSLGLEQLVVNGYHNHCGIAPKDAKLWPLENGMSRQMKLFTMG